ncbi:class I SAM-dependent methyltransferase [Stappia sp. WLB 29]|uniref:class I SAM-dependent methyltransferase n=1 Tax=Stappia sp. WLB 29 TaxID=2925220 RepID=UPI0020C0A556|nr:class I SAM-dependent methyltransferase [Stappia sp. WLB 29]
MSGDKPDTAGFMDRRDAARERLDGLFGAKGGKRKDRSAWFDAVYQTAEGDAAAVPWADLAPKAELVDWLVAHPGEGQLAVDVGCGLGDNAEALAEAGYRTTGFDLSPKAVEWARQRFPESAVDYRAADLFDLPADWGGRFDLVHECYTLQALSGDLRERAFAAVASLVAPRGRLLVLTRTAPEGSTPDGPPWPLALSELGRFSLFGLQRIDRHPYNIRKGERIIAHVRDVWQRAG